MVLPFPWKEGEGYDIHVLRGPVKSKSLLPSLTVDTSPNALKPVFTPNFTAATSVLGVDVNSTTGEVTALLQPPGQPNKFPSFNFLIKAHQAVGGVATYETEIRVHVHTSIKSIWLTPSSLRPHVNSNECRFTVLARFDDDVVGDITDWPASQLSFKSSAPSVLAVLAAGGLQAKVEGKTAVVTATVKQPAPFPAKTATAQVSTLPNWIAVGRTAKLEFISGPQTPNPTDLDSANADSVKSVQDARTNVLFIAEGFVAGQEADFRQVIEALVTKQLQVNKSLDPFRFLAQSINYWAVFMESKEEGTTVLGDQAVANSLANPIPLPRLPAQNASQWTVPNMIHEGGLPLPNDPPAADPNAWVANRNNTFTLPPGAPGAPAIDQAGVNDWNALRPRFQLNERNTAFGLAHFDRPKVSDEFSADRLLLNPRRVNESSLSSFLGALTFGNLNTQVWGVGTTWVKSLTGGKDAGLVCFICRSDLRGGLFRPFAMGPSVDYFTASMGDKDHIDVKAAGDGFEVVPPSSMAFSEPLVASLVAYGCSSALGLGDERGDGLGGVPNPATFLRGENLQEESSVVNIVGGARIIDVKKIAWLWPRIAKAALVKVELNASGGVKTPENCDQNGAPNPTGKFLLVQLLSNPPKPFAVGDLVRLRGVMARDPNDLEWRSPSRDEIAGYPLKIESVGKDTLVLSRQTPIVPQLGYRDPVPGTQLQPDLFKPVEKCAVIVPRLGTGAAAGEQTLISKRMLDQLTSSNSPLNAPLNPQGQACTPARDPRGDIVASNLPTPFKVPAKLPSKADLIGLYDGGGHFDCGVFRPAGRCQMRRSTSAAVTFCQVCSYVIVDRVDPTVHGVLDDQYDPRYPQ